MRTRHLLPILLALAAVVVTAQEKPKPAKPKSGILVVSLMRAIDESDEGREILAKLREEQASKNQELTEQAQKLQEKVRELRQAKPADRDEAYYKELKKAMETSAHLEMEKRLFEMTKQDELARAMQQLLIGAQQEARTIMKERGAEIVLLTKTGPIELTTDQDVQQEFALRRVLCADDSIDITDEVIARMNKWYKENKSSVGLPNRGGAEKAADKESGKPKGAAKPE